MKQEPKGNKHFNARGDNNFSFETSLPIERPIYEQYIYSEKKDGGNWPVIKLKELNQKIPFRTFQNGSSRSLKTLLRKITRPQGCTSMCRMMSLLELSLDQFLFLCFDLHQLHMLSQISWKSSWLCKNDRDPHSNLIGTRSWFLAEQRRRVHRYDIQTFLYFSV